MTFWFTKNRNIDLLIREVYLPMLGDILEGNLEDWKETPRGYLCTIIVLDQFSRHIYRNKPQSFQNDALALQLTLKGMEQGIDQALYPIERTFFYMPLQHSENQEHQEKSVQLYTDLLDEVHQSLKPPFLEFLKYAKFHLRRIKLFGRFPDRNAILKRPSTPKEESFLSVPGLLF